MTKPLPRHESHANFETRREKFPRSHPNVARNNSRGQSFRRWAPAPSRQKYRTKVVEPGQTDSFPASFRGESRLRFTKLAWSWRLNVSISAVKFRPKMLTRRLSTNY